MSCLDSDYIRRLKYLSNNRRDFSIIENMPNQQMARKERLATLNNDEENAMLSTKGSSIQNGKLSKASDFKNSLKHSPSINSTSTRIDSICCSFLFGNRKNDFFNENKSNKKSINRNSSLTRKSSNKANDKVINSDNLQSINLNERFNSQPAHLNNKSSITTTVTTANFGMI